MESFCNNIHYRSKGFFEEMYTFIQQRCIKLIKYDSKDIYKVANTLCFR